MSVNIKVIGEGCDRCDTLFNNTIEAVAELQLDAEIEKIENLIEIVKLGVLSAPSLMVDGKLLVSGQVASTEKIIKLLKKYQ